MRSVARGARMAAVGALVAAGATGCVDRLLQVRSDPPGASVWVNGAPAGTTPCDHRFSFYGTVDVTVRAPGHQSHRELKRLPAPWYQYFPIDFFADLVVPWTIRDVHTISVELEPSPPEITPARRQELDERARSLEVLLPAEASPEGPR